MRFESVIFDLDGTLVDSYQALTTALNLVARDHGRATVSIDQVRRMVGEGVERLLERAFGACDPVLTSSFDGHYDACFATGTLLLADVEQTLASLRACGVRMAVCTNKPTRFSRAILQTLRIDHFFDAVAGPDVALARKPEAEHLLYTIRAVGGEPGRCLMVGDMPIDVAAARAAGCEVAGIATGSSSVEELRAAGPDHLLARFTDLIELVCGAEVSA